MKMPVFDFRLSAFGKAEEPGGRGQPTIGIEEANGPGVLPNVDSRKPNAGSSRRDILKVLAGGTGLLVWRVDAPAQAADPRAAPDYDWEKHWWAYAVDTNKCIGCTACMRACRTENDVPEGVVRTWVERYRIKSDGDVVVDATANEPDYVFKDDGVQAERSFFVPKLCNHCEKSVCNQVCPVGAAYQTKDGVVLVDRKHCVGCGYCVQACPYGSRFISPKLHVADKCTFCYHRLAKGMAPACVQACPTGARLFGDLKDPHSTLSELLRQKRYRVLKPEMGTHPKCYYLGLDREVV